ncbi:MAG: beta-ketoacyl-ACP synthase II [Proteobacteria bacterium]|nr:beta-ketoacyl-ACP synthase II [Pseudomonadota bacterium]MCH7893357.1 beta-ketoacyl-ACP synthase II [Pseudomonadota bacterium]
MAKRRVVVTGLGIVSPVGNTVSDAWQTIVSGKSGIGLITRMDTSLFTTQIGGPVRDFDIGEYIEPKDARKMDPFIHYGIAASEQALIDSGLEITDENRHRIGVAVGAGIGGLETIEASYGKYIESGKPRKISPFFIPSSIINMVAGHVSIRNKLTGPNVSLVTACTTATHCIGIGMRMIQYGDADVMVAGGCEMAATVLGLGGFCSARALSCRNDDPERASRPWDAERDGFVLSDGAGCLVLEELEHAQKRGANILAELIGFGMSADAFHMTAPLESGEGASLCMENALADARLNPDEVDYINAHGTSTPLGDIAETKAIKQAFGDHAYRLAVSSTKSMTGHLLGAAGGVEAIFSILAIRDQVAPPTINLEHADPECDLDYVPNEAREMHLRVAVSNSFGFGGTNGTLVFAQFS